MGKKASWLTLDWSAIEACTCKNDEEAQILRVFPRRRADKWPPLAPGARSGFARRLDGWFVPWIQKTDHVDMDFRFAEQPRRDIVRAFDACRASGVAVRDFGEMTQSDKARLAEHDRYFRYAFPFLALLLIFGVSMWFGK